MSNRIKSFSNGCWLEYDTGKFDDYCIYFCYPSCTYCQGSKHAVKDAEYFANLKTLADMFGTQRVYNDFLRIYNMAGKQVESLQLQGISAISRKYGWCAREADIVFTILYMGMIAENNKKNTKLGKRVKRLGVYLLLIKNYIPEQAARALDTNTIKPYLKPGQQAWEYLDGWCRQYHF